MFDNYPDIVTVENIMGMLNIGKASVYKLLKDKQIRFVKIGRKYIIPKKSILSFLEEGCYNETQTNESGLH